MAITKSQAKALLDKDEFELYSVATGASLKKLTVAELDNFVGRSRVLRDKWNDLSKKHRRASQGKAGQRQTAENARTDQKLELLRAAHQAFVDRLAAVKAGSVEAAEGTKAAPIRRETRKVINRVDRAVVRQQTAQAQEAIVVQQRKSRKTSTKDRAISRKAKTGATAKTRATAKTGATAKANPGSNSKSSTAAKAKPGTKPGVKAKPQGKSSAVVAAAAAKKSRAKAAAKRAAAQATTGTKPQLPEISSKAAARKPQSEGLSKAEIAANRKLGGKASKTRIAMGGNTRITSHVSAANRRNQTRRDSK